ncbi:MAG: FAD-dependent oxidoreductase, partial [Actinobacteria bacterium]|nr:FAD-dependent oxidoreductase [Actinomycetota bacterium]
MSLWWELVERPTFSPESLDRQWDVLIVGAGFSGLWSAHHLLERNPELKIAVVEKSTVGSGASGRNGGWASALYPVTEENLRKNFTAGAIDSLNLHLRGAIDEIEAFTKKNKIDCGFAKGGTLTVARNKGQLA